MYFVAKNVMREGGREGGREQTCITNGNGLDSISAMCAAVATVLASDTPSISKLLCCIYPDQK